MIERIYEPAVVNAVSNHFSIRPWIAAGRTDPLDATPFIADPRNVYLAGDHGLAIFHFIAPGLYEAHYRVLPQGRGKWALGFLYAALAWMFEHDEVDEIRCRVPRGNIACRAIVHNICAEPIGEIPDGWIDEDGNAIPARVYSMSRLRWQRLNANS